MLETIIITIIVCWAFAALYYIVNAKKLGKSTGCAGNCLECMKKCNMSDCVEKDGK